MNDNIHQTLQDLPSAPKEEMEWDIARVLDRLRSQGDSPARLPVDERIAAFERTTSSIRWRRFAAIPAAAAILLAMVLAVTWRQDAFAVVETGKLYRVADGKSVVSVPVNTPVRTDDGAVLKLQDGSRVQMNEKSEVVFEHANTQTRILVNDGSVNVTPSKEPAGMLIVQNRDIAAQTSKPAEPKLSFEVASIRPSDTAAPATPGGRGGGRSPAGNGCGGPGIPTIDPRVFIATNFSLFNLISKAYPEWAGPYQGCMGVIGANLLTGGENWMRTELWDIRATIPEGTPAYTGMQFFEGKAPELSKMLQTLLAERFKVVLRKETKTIPVYFLNVKGGPKFNGIKQSTIERSLFVQDGKTVSATEANDVYMMTIGNDDNGKRFTNFTALNLTMSDFAKSLIFNTNRVVVDKTGLTGRYSFYLEIGIDPNGALARGLADNLAPRPTMMDAIEEVGLKLEPGTAPVEVWSVEHAERPREN